MGGALGEFGFAEEVFRSARAPGSLGSSAAMDAFVRVLFLDIDDMVNHPEVTVERREVEALKLIEAAADRLLQQSGEAWWADLPGRLAGRYPNIPGERDRIIQFLIDAVAAYGEIVLFSTTPGVLPEQWQEGVSLLIESTAGVLLGVEEEEDALVDPGEANGSGEVV